MNALTKLTAAAVVMIMATGCATGPGQAAGNAATTVGNGISNTLSGVGSGLSNMFSSMDYKNGVHVSDEQVAAFKRTRTTKQDVINTVGHPPMKSNVSGLEVWTFPYIHAKAIPLGGGGAHESTVFEFSGNTLKNVYKAGPVPGTSGDPRMDMMGR